MPSIADTLQSNTHPETWALSSEGTVRADKLNPWYYKVSANPGCLAMELVGSQRGGGNSEVICHSGRNWVKIPNTWVAFFFPTSNFSTHFKFYIECKWHHQDDGCSFYRGLGAYSTDALC